MEQTNSIALARSFATITAMFLAPPASCAIQGETKQLDTNQPELSQQGSPLDEASAEAAVGEVYQAQAAAIVEAKAASLNDGVLEHDAGTLRMQAIMFGDTPEGERSLWISMHGGGGAPAAVNDQQWQNQIRLYEPDEGLYIAPRAPVDAWNMWHVPEIDIAFDTLIDACVASRGIDPDCVYLLGYSAGGDGVYQLAPRMADRFAAASMMAGHPNESQPLGLRNLPFAIFMGADDDAFNRNGIAQEWADRLAALKAEDTNGYEHLIRIYEGLGHWMDRRDAEALPWMTGFQRNAWPDRVVWRQDDVVRDRFYWLAVQPGVAHAGDTVIASVVGQTIIIEQCDTPTLRLRLRDALIDLDLPIRVVLRNTDTTQDDTDAQTLFEGRVQRTRAAIEASMAERLDAPAAATALLDITIPQTQP